MMSLYPSFSSTINMMCGAEPAVAGAASAASGVCVAMPATGDVAIVRAATGRAAPNAPTSVSVTAPTTLRHALAPRRAGVVRPPRLVIPPPRSNHIGEAGARAGLAHIRSAVEGGDRPCPCESGAGKSSGEFLCARRAHDLPGHLLRGLLTSDRGALSRDQIDRGLRSEGQAAQRRGVVPPDAANDNLVSLQRDGGGPRGRRG